jgi:hypothetical protein
MTTSRRTYYAKRKISTSSKGKKSKSKRRNLRGGNRVSDEDIKSIIKYFGRLAYDITKLRTLSFKDLIVRKETLMAKIQQLMDCYNVNTLSRIDNNLRGRDIGDLTKYFNEEIKAINNLLKENNITFTYTSVHLHDTQTWVAANGAFILEHFKYYKKAGWLKDCWNIGIPENGCHQTFYTPYVSPLGPLPPLRTE